MRGFKGEEEVGREGGKEGGREGGESPMCTIFDGNMYVVYSSV